MTTDQPGTPTTREGAGLLCTTHPERGTTMAHIAHRLGEFTGHIGPVRFTKGHAETDDQDLLDYFRAEPDTFDVTDDSEPDHLEDPGQGQAEDPTDDPED